MGLWKLRGIIPWTKSLLPIVQCLSFIWENFGHHYFSNISSNLFFFLVLLVFQLGIYYFFSFLKFTSQFSVGFCLFFHSYLLYGLKFLLSYLQTHQACVEFKDESVEDFICWNVINFYYYFLDFPSLWLHFLFFTSLYLGIILSL